MNVSILNITNKNNYMEEKVITVKELIALLEKIENKEKLVWLEGCDCHNQATGEISEDEDSITIEI